MSYTENLEDLGYSEREDFIKILMEWQSCGLPDSFWPNEVRLGFNSSSGCVFLTNAEYQTCMLYNGTLAQHYNLPDGGVEGFLDELVDYYTDLSEGDREYLCEIAEGEGKQIVLCVDESAGSVSFCPQSEEFGIIKGDDEAWFPSHGSVQALFAEVMTLPEGEDDES